MLAAATKRTVSDYAAEKLWQPLGAEADATWIIDATGQEITFAYVNAVLRDWARLGLMMAHGGRWAGRTVVPAKWIAESTSVQPEWPSSTDQERTPKQIPWVERPPGTPAIVRHGQIASQLHDSKYEPRTCQSASPTIRRLR